MLVIVIVSPKSSRFITVMVARTTSPVRALGVIPSGPTGVLKMAAPWNNCADAEAQNSAPTDKAIPAANHTEEIEFRTFITQTSKFVCHSLANHASCNE